MTDVRKGDWPVARWLAPVWLLACILLGGSSSGGVLANGLLQLAALGLLIWMAVRGAFNDITPPARHLLLIAGVAATWLALTLVPMPPELWRLLPGRGEVARGFVSLDVSMPWRPISLAPDATIAALLSFLPPLAMFLIALMSSLEGRRAAVIALAVVALTSVLYGVAQQVSGYRSDLYIYDITSRGGAVGFFANRNHLATLCLMAMPFLAALAVSGGRGASDETRLGGWTIALGALLVLGVGAMLVQSRAGWILLVPTVLTCHLVFRGRRRGGRSRPLAVALLVVALVAVLAALFAPIGAADLESGLSEIRPRDRQGIARLTWFAALDHLPLGAGVGSFVALYPRYENLATITPTFANHAHNEYLELLLEGGVPGLILLGAFLFWLVVRTRAAWSVDGGAPARAGCAAIGILLAHSFVDYPFRTAAIASVAALACAVASITEERYAAARSRRRGRGNAIMLGAAARPRRSSPAAMTTSESRARIAKSRPFHDLSPRTTRSSSTQPE